MKVKTMKKNYIALICALLSTSIVFCDGSKSEHQKVDQVNEFIKSHDFDGLSKLLQDKSVRVTKDHVALAQKETEATRAIVEKRNFKDLLTYLVGTAEIAACATNLFLATRVKDIWMLDMQRKIALGSLFTASGLFLFYESWRNYCKALIFTNNKRNYERACAIESLIKSSIN